MRVAVFIGLLAFANADCTSYCTAVMANCMGANLIYSTTQSCMDECAAFPAGGGTGPTDATNADNNVNCREYHATAAATDATAATTHCPHARPDPSAFCVSAGSTGPCDNYCDNLMKSCTVTPANPFVPGKAACIKSCLAWSDKASMFGMAPSGTTGYYPLPATSTGALACRRYHVQVARTDTTVPPAGHCLHADISGAGVCGTPCDALCAQATVNCWSNQTGYADMTTCLAICANMPTGAAADTTVDSQYCRVYHAVVANTDMSSMMTHCPHTGQASGACGTNCDAYCSQYIKACGGTGGAGTPYTDMSACTTACAAWPAGTMGATSGATLACRIYHLGVAQTAGMAAMHCPHAQAMPTAVCVGGMTPTAMSPTNAPTNSASTVAATIGVAIPAFLTMLL